VGIAPTASARRLRALLIRPWFASPRVVQP